MVWGEAKVINGDIKGYGLSKIEAKHLNDFESFKGDTPQEKLINGINEIIEKGEIKPRSGQDGVNIEYNGFIIGINKGFNGAGDNKWVVTAFDNSMSKSEKKAKTARTDNFTSEVSNLSQNSKPNSTPKEIKSQNATQDAPKTTQEIIKEGKEAGKSGKEIVQAIKENKAKNAQTPKMVQKATNEAQLFDFSEQLQVKSKEPTAKEAKNITFIDAKGKEREITKQVQEQWLETFNLKSLDEDFIPQIPKEIEHLFNGGIHLKVGSLIKLENRERSDFFNYEEILVVIP